MPPSIIEDSTSTDLTVDERSRVSLRCKSDGYPTPRVIWRREDGKEINLGPMGVHKSGGFYLKILLVEYSCTQYHVFVMH